jgi:2'-5' RNA ligase
MSSNPASGGQVETKTRRLFFALWPDAGCRQQIKRHCKSLLQHGGGRAVDPDNLHFTLAFLGNVNAKQQACVEQMADQVRLSSLEFTVDVAGHWAKPRVLWVGPGDMPEVLVTLATKLRDGAISCGIQMDMRPYRAHMTLMRKVSRVKESISVRPFVWHANSFVLVKSVTHQEGVKYEVIREWSLA